MSEESKPKRQFKEIIQTSFRLVKIVWQTDKLLFSISVFATIIPSIIPFINAYIYKLIIDVVVNVIAGNELVLSSLYILLGIRILTVFVQDAAYITQEYASNLLWTKMPITLNDLLLRKISSLDIQYFENSKFKDLLERVRDSYAYRPQNLINNLLYGLQSAVQLLIALIAIAQLNWILTAIILFVAIPEFINQNKQSQLSWTIWSWNSPLQKRFWYLANLLQDAVSIKEIKIFKLATKFLQDIKEIHQKFYRENAQLARRSYILNLGTNTLGIFAFIGTEIFIVLEALARRVTIGDISFYTAVVTNFQTGLGGLFRNMNGVYESSLYVSSIFEVLDTKPFIKSSTNQHQIFNTKVPVIEFKNVDFTYPDTSQKILKSFSLIIKPAEKIAFVGENGAGKSTIIKLLTRLYDVDKGEILFNNVNIKDIPIDDLHKQIGVLFQDFNMYEYSVTDNIYYGNITKPSSMGDIKKAAVLAGADIVIEKLENKYEQMLGRTFEHGVELSVGQWQKIALARAFYRNSPILILDEPTASIDAKAESEIFERVNSLTEGKTVIIVSHRFSTVRQADKIYVINNGKISEAGNHQELMKLNGEYATLFNLQAKGYK